MDGTIFLFLAGSRFHEHAIALKMKNVMPFMVRKLQKLKSGFTKIYYPYYKAI
ncbi:MAG: hypothetical protein LWW97_07320 [Deltaproteobacteria bacterium]|nr:hypothetical protein [Deltaproteobacteria bacterium]